MASYKFIIVILLFSNLSFAELLPASCFQPKTTTVDLDQFTPIIDEILNHCPDDLRINLAQHNYAKNFKSDIGSYNKHGFKLSDQQKALNALDIILGEKPILPESAKDCSKVICVLTKAYGSELAALESLNLYADSGYRLSLNRINEKQKKTWNSEKVLSTIDALKKLPKALSHIPHMQDIHVFGEELTIHQHTNSDRFKNTKALASIGYKNGQYKTSIIFNHSVHEDDHNLFETLAHELAHQLDYTAYVTESSTSLARNLGFYELSGWKEVGGYYHYDEDKACFTSNYAQTSPSEHFSETVAHFITDPLTLKTKCPKFYDFIAHKILPDFDPFNNNEWTEFDHLIARSNKNPNECLGRPIEKIIAFNKTTYFLQKNSKDGMFFDSFDSEFDKVCLSTLYADEIAQLAKSEDFCHNGGIDGVLDKIAKKAHQINEFIHKSSDIYAQDFDQLESLKRCQQNSELTVNCMTKEHKDHILKMIEESSDLEKIFAPENVRLMAKNFTDNLNIRANTQFEEFTSQNLSPLLSGLFQCIDSIRVDINKVVKIKRDVFISDSPANFKECPEQGLKHIGVNKSDRKVLNWVYNKSIMDTLDQLSTEILTQLPDFKSQCSSDRDCISLKLSNELTSKLKLSITDSQELAKIIVSKYP